ncbi:MULTISPECIES: hypothetical protein [Brevibacterium]|uniref:Uncharacterized protein n=2 Tax=Brevibacterium linens TaxID=1703 RepID=A0A2H1KLW9_BRELN|nr:MULTISPECIES: hypothetical protein [Brevibacterium]SMY00537.1 hypothetical protein BLIN9172_03295 [Brevibacterium linens ATCC 9172]SMY00588.1 hypothetical protein BLIN101_03454 [Brevibacterium linens]
MLSGLFNIFGQVGLLIGAAAGMALIGPLLLGVVLAAMGVVVVISAPASRRMVPFCLAATMPAFVLTDPEGNKFCLMAKRIPMEPEDFHD